MEKKKESKPSVEKYKIQGHSIQIRKEGNVEQLFIDGIPKKHFKNDAGYVLHDNIYEEPHKSLIEAVKIHLQRASKKRRYKESICISRVKDSSCVGDATRRRA